MTTPRRPGASHRALHFAAKALCAVSLAACSDGYPTEDIPQIDPANMTQAQLLAALNALGKGSRTCEGAGAMRCTATVNWRSRCSTATRFTGAWFSKVRWSVPRLWTV